MTNKQIAAAVGAVLVALAGVLSQCPDEPPTPKPPVPALSLRDAGAPL